MRQISSILSQSTVRPAGTCHKHGGGTSARILDFPIHGRLPLRKVYGITWSRSSSAGTIQPGHEGIATAEKVTNLRMKRGAVSRLRCET